LGAIIKAIILGSGATRQPECIKCVDKIILGNVCSD
jgi:hypothetical protein